MTITINDDVPSASTNNFLICNLQMGPAMSTTFELYSLPNLILPHFRHEYAAKLVKLKDSKLKRNHLKATTKLRFEIGILITQNILPLSKLIFHIKT